MTDRYAVIGNPIGHTKSPLIHRLFAQATAQDIDYGAIEGPLQGFAQALRDFRDGGPSSSRLSRSPTCAARAPRSRVPPTL